MSDDTREKLARTVMNVTDRWDEPLDAVHDIPQILDAILSRFDVREKAPQVGGTGCCSDECEADLLEMHLMEPPC